MSAAMQDAQVEQQRRAALRTALVCGAIALGFFVAAFLFLGR